MNVNELQVFEKEEFGKVRVIESNNDVWFVAKDVSEILDYNTTAHMTRLLEDDEKKVDLTKEIVIEENPSIKEKEVEEPKDEEKEAK